MTEAKYALEQMNSISNRKFSTKNAFNVDSDQTSKQYKKLLDRALRLYVNDTDLNENETSIEKIPSSSQPLFFVKTQNSKTGAEEYGLLNVRCSSQCIDSALSRFFEFNETGNHVLNFFGIYKSLYQVFIFGDHRVTFSDFCIANGDRRCVVVRNRFDAARLCLFIPKIIENCHEKVLGKTFETYKKKLRIRTQVRFEKAKLKQDI